MRTFDLVLLAGIGAVAWLLFSRRASAPPTGTTVNVQPTSGYDVLLGGIQAAGNAWGDYLDHQPQVEITDPSGAPAPTMTPDGGLDFGGSGSGIRFDSSRLDPTQAPRVLAAQSFGPEQSLSARLTRR